MVLLVLISAIVALRIGSGAINWSSFFQALFHPPINSNPDMTGNGLESNLDRVITIIWSIRFPRILVALLIGAGLAASGCVLQGLLRNPLAEPYTLGISGGAALGATLAMILIPSVFGIWSLPLTAFLGALLAVGLIYLIASRQHFSVIGLILAGVILSFIFSAIVLFIFVIASPNEVKSTLLWLMGNLSSLNINLLNIIPFFIIGGIILLWLFGRELDAMSLGDEKAFHLGVNTITIRKWLFIITSLVVGACIATAGMIGFVGLIIPHLMRLIIGPKHRPLILASALAGAGFLVVCDTIARTLLSSYGQELPVGVVTGIIGGIFFLLFLMKRKLNYQ